MDYQEEIMRMVSNITNEKVLKLIYAFIHHLASNPELQALLGKGGA